MTNSSDIQVCNQNLASLNSSAELLAGFKFYGQGVTVVVLSVFGIVGNTLAILTISSMNKVSLFYKLLIALAIFDVIFIVTGGLFIVQTAFKFELPIYYRVFPFLIYPAAGISMTGSTYACLSIAAERYFGICYPNMDSCYRKFRFYVVGIALACIFIDTPRFFEVQTVVNDADVAVGVEYTALRTDGTYIVFYFMWFRLISTIALPFGLMLYFNIKVFSYYKQNSMQSHHLHQEKSLMAIFSCITVTFFLCHLPRVVLNIYEFQLHRNSGFCKDVFGTRFVPPPWFFITTCVEKILLILNASANFLYYCFSGREFRNRFCQILHCRLVPMSSNVYTEEVTRCVLTNQNNMAAYESVVLALNTLQREANIAAIRVESAQETAFAITPPTNATMTPPAEEAKGEVINGEHEQLSSINGGSPQIKLLCVHFLGHIYAHSETSAVV